MRRDNCLGKPVPDLQCVGSNDFFLVKGREVELFLGCLGENGMTKGGGKELTFTCLEKRGMFFDQWRRGLATCTPECLVTCLGLLEEP